MSTESRIEPPSSEGISEAAARNTVALNPLVGIRGQDLVDSAGILFKAMINEPKVATERVQTEFLTVEPGQAAGVHQIARGLAEGKELIYMELQMYVGAKDPADKVELKGHPNISLVIPGGSHGDIATASVAVNSIPVILEAPSGLRTSRDLPIGFFSARPLK